MSNLSNKTNFSNFIATSDERTLEVSDWLDEQKSLVDVMRFEGKTSAEIRGKLTKAAEVALEDSIPHPILGDYAVFLYDERELSKAKATKERYEALCDKCGVFAEFPEIKASSRRAELLEGLHKALDDMQANGVSAEYIDKFRLSCENRIESESRRYENVPDFDCL